MPALFHFGRPLTKTSGNTAESLKAGLEAHCGTAKPTGHCTETSLSAQGTPVHVNQAGKSRPARVAVDTMTATGCMREPSCSMKGLQGKFSLSSAQDFMVNLAESLVSLCEDFFCGRPCPAEIVLGFTPRNLAFLQNWTC